MLILMASAVQIFRKERFFYGHDNYDQLVKIAKVYPLLISLNIYSHVCVFFNSNYAYLHPPNLILMLCEWLFQVRLDCTVVKPISSLLYTFLFLD